jgi:HSP20 family protein
MARSSSHDWMWSEAMDMLARAERLHRQMFRPPLAQSGPPAWEPPVDVLETQREVLIMAALPGVDPNEVEVSVEDGGVLVLSGRRALPRELKIAAIHRMELPQGRFERRIPLPPGRYGAVRRAVVHGCFVISLEKAPVDARLPESRP